MKKDQTQKLKNIAKLIFNSSLDKEGKLSGEKLIKTLDTISTSSYYSSALLKQVKKLCQSYFDARNITLESPVELDQSIKQMLKKNISEEVHTIVNPNLITGVKVKVGWDEYDSSSALKLNRLLD